MKKETPQNHYKLKCKTMNYDWGNTNEESIIRQLTGIKDKQPIAELWMGAHSKAPSLLSVNGEDIALNTFIENNKEHILGTDLFKGGVETLPFLLKVIDIAKPLSIQAHPDKKRAQTLHQLDPNNYPDANHKPEVAICIKGMEALVGFRRPGQIFSYFMQIPELGNICSNEGALYKNKIPPRPELLSRFQKRNWIKHHYSNLMKASKSEIEEAVVSHIFRLESLETTPNRKVDKLFLKLVNLFGKKDPGVFSPFFLNYVQLQPGQALYLGPNEPHSYIAGQIIECMSASDNVVRAGLTTKYCDIETLIGMLHYNFGPPQIQSVKSSVKCKHGYRLDVPDFEVYHIELKEQAICQVPDLARPSIYLVLKGTIKLNIKHKIDGLSSYEFKEGEVFLLPGDLYNKKVEVTITGQAKESVCYQATVGQSFR